MIFDSHAHYDDSRYSTDRTEILSKLPELGIGRIMNVGSSLNSSKTSVELSEQYDYIYAAVGIHPHEAEEIVHDDFDFNLISGYFSSPKVKAVGEIGLDYHYDFSPREIQKQCFDKFLQLAHEINKPVIIHDREAHADCLNMVKRYRLRGVFHCYSGSLEMAKELVALGFYIGITGVITFNNAKKLAEVAKWLPDERILIETDCPYLSPVPHRGERNHSGNLKYVAQTLSSLRGTSPDDIIALTYKNASDLFLCD